MGFKHRIAPLKARILGEAPLCPWNSLIKNLHPVTIRAQTPPIDIRILEKSGGLHLLRFAGKHEFWFPETMVPNAELWSEYLVTTWNHPSNPHFYLKGGVNIGSGDVVLDCGACEGFFTRQALDLGAKKVLCVEPNPEMATCLNVSFPNEIATGRLIIIPVALGSLTGEANFNVSPGDAFSGRFDGTGGNRVPIVTLDQLVTEYGAPTMIKMDLEGSEYEALHGGMKLLENNHPKLAITTYHHSWDYAVVKSLLQGMHYFNFSVSSAIMRDGKIPRPVMIHAWN
jgi:FkbM family methyltransferase